MTKEKERKTYQSKTVPELALEIIFIMIQWNGETTYCTVVIVEMCELHSIISWLMRDMYLPLI